MAPFKKYVTCIMAFFTPFNFHTVTLCQFCCTTSPVSFAKLHQETIEWEGKKVLAYMVTSSYHAISTEIENLIFKHDWIIRHLAFINNPLWKSREISIFLCKYYIVIPDTLVGSFLDVLLLWFAVILSELHEKPRKKDWVREKST